MVYYLVLFPSSIILMFRAFPCGDNGMSTQTRIPDSDEGSTSMGLFNDTEQCKEDIHRCLLLHCLSQRFPHC